MSTRQALAAAWHGWHVRGSPPRRPSRTIVLLVWAGREYGSVEVERVGWSGRHVVVAVSAPPREGCVRPQVVGGGLELLAVPPPRASVPALAGVVQVRERADC